MARITVEDCLLKVDNQYDLVLLAKERTTQLNSGLPMLVEEDNDKKTIISLREIGDGKISVEDLEKSAVTRLRKEPDEGVEQEVVEEEENDDFENCLWGDGDSLDRERVRDILLDKFNYDHKDGTW